MLCNDITNVLVECTRDFILYYFFFKYKMRAPALVVVVALYAVLGVFVVEGSDCGNGSIRVMNVGDSITLGLISMRTAFLGDTGWPKRKK